MRDTAGELADGLDLLRLAECGLGAPARGHVEKAADNADELPARVPFDLLGDGGVQHLAGFRNEPVFRVPQLAERKQPRPIDLRSPAGRRFRHELGQGPALRLLAAIAEEIEPGVADVLDARIAIERMQGEGSAAIKASSATKAMLLGC